MVTGKLSRGTRLKLTSHHSYPLEMSAHGGVPSPRKLEVAAGTEVEVARDCEPDDFDIQIHFIERSLKERANGQPFYAVRPFLEEERIA